MFAACFCMRLKLPESCEVRRENVGTNVLFSRDRVTDSPGSGAAGALSGLIVWI